jgi:hypothetical protein
MKVVHLFIKNPNEIIAATLNKIFGRYSQKFDELKETYKILIRPLGLWDIAFTLTSKYFRAKLYKNNDIPSMIEHFSLFIDEL